MHMDNSLLDQLPFPCFIIDEDFRIISSSTASTQYFTYSNSFISLIDPVQKDEFETFLAQLEEAPVIEINMVTIDAKKKTFQVYKQNPKTSSICLYCIPKEPDLADVNGMLKKVESKISSLKGEIHEKNQYFVDTVTDIKEAAIHSDQLATLGKLAAGVAHEIRNPLTTVKGFIQLIKPYLSEAGKEDYAMIALDEINRANEIIHEFLNAAKPQVHKKQVIDINKLVKSILILYESEAILRNLDIELVPECENTNLCLDIKQIKQVLVNIFKNAIEAIEQRNSEEKGFIKIKTQISGSYGVIVIEDNGIGMDEKTKESLFVPFFSTKENGTGIGMTVCKKIIEEHLGKITVESKLNQGTLFRIEFPIYQTIEANV